MDPDTEKLLNDPFGVFLAIAQTANAVTLKNVRARAVEAANQFHTAIEEVKRTGRWPVAAIEDRLKRLSDNIANAFASRHSDKYESSIFEEVRQQLQKNGLYRD